MIIINAWTGRLGNNILQIIRAIHFANYINDDTIVFNNHHFLLKNQIILPNNKNTKQYVHNFFNLSVFGISDPEPIEMKNIFQKHIRSIFKLNYVDLNSDDIYIHFRGGDIMSENCAHGAYVQPPLVYYQKAINNYKNINLVCEDKKNPVINKLIEKFKCELHNGTLENDLELLCNCSNLCIGFGTFGFLLYLVNTNLKKLYLPKYVYESLPKGSWGDNIELIIIDIPNYIEVGKWTFSKEQQELMINYKFSEE